MSESRFTMDTLVDFEAQADDSPVIRNVLLCGNSSRNGYEIPPSAFGGDEGVKRLYESRLCFIDHATPNPLNRSTRDLAGTVMNARLVNGRAYGDIDCEAAPAGPLLLDLARKRIPGIGLSHAASYRRSADGRTVLEITAVYSVDVVVRPATTNSFYEQVTAAEIEHDALHAAYRKLVTECERLADNQRALDEAGERAHSMASRMFCRPM